MPTKESNIVKRTLDLKKPPQLSAEQKARLDAVASMPDEQIDYSDAAQGHAGGGTVAARRTRNFRDPDRA